jgi:hypothetical protein
MNDKFFFFKRFDPASDGAVFSDSGKSLSSLAVPASSMSYMTAKKGYVVVFFNNTTPYEENSLLEGQSFLKASVSIPCEEGNEFTLMEDIMNFVSRKDSNKAIMRFDALSINSTFSSYKVQETSAVVPSIPLNRGTSTQKNLSSGTTIAGVDFLSTENLPLVDYNETAGGIGNPLAKISTWENDSTATLSSDANYNLVQSTTDNKPAVAAADDIVNTKYVEFYDPTFKKYLETTTELEVKRDFVMYCAVVINEETPAYPFYSNDITQDSNGLFPENGGISEFNIRFSDNDALNFKSNVTFPNKYTGSENSDTSLFIFVLRRDHDKNIYIYDKNGDIIASKLYSLETDGSFKFKYLGGALSRIKMKVARFGVVGKDLEDDLCRSIAISLNNHYRV